MLYQTPTLAIHAPKATANAHNQVILCNQRKSSQGFCPQRRLGIRPPETVKEKSTSNRHKQPKHGGELEKKDKNEHGCPGDTEISRGDTPSIVLVPFFIRTGDLVPPVANLASEPIPESLDRGLNVVNNGGILVIVTVTIATFVTTIITVP